MRKPFDTLFKRLVGSGSLFDRPIRRVVNRTRRWNRRGTRRTRPSGAGVARGSQDGGLFARARPKKVSVTETYRYHQVLSVNPSIGTVEAPSGCIEVVVPYDGHEFFTRDAIKDVAARLEPATGADTSTDAEAMIGHLLLLDVREAMRTDVESSAPLPALIPLCIPVRSTELRGEGDLRSDRRESHLAIDYYPPDPGDYPYPASLTAELFDPDDAPQPVQYPTGARSKKRASELSRQIIHQAAFSSGLRLTLRLKLLWPRRTKEPPNARIKRVSLDWPTITSLSENSLRFSLGGIPERIQHNPRTRKLECVNIPIEQQRSPDPEPETNTARPDREKAEKNSENKDDVTVSAPSNGAQSAAKPSTVGTSGPDHESAHRGISEGSAEDKPQDSESDSESGSEFDDSDEELTDNAVWTMRSQEMQLIIEHPGELRSAEKLSGKVEIEIGDQLYSGIDARLFNALGRRVRRRADGPLTLRTRMTLDFDLVLEDQFNRRMVTARHTLQFDEVIPNDHRIDDIASVLRDRGFDIDRWPRYDFGDGPMWVIDAIRREGPSEIMLLLVVGGRHHKTRRQAGTPGWHRYTSKLDSGELWLSVYGAVPRESRELTSEVNELRRALSARFEHVQAQR